MREREPGRGERERARERGEELTVRAQAVRATVRVWELCVSVRVWGAKVSMDYERPSRKHHRVVRDLGDDTYVAATAAAAVAAVPRSGGHALGPRGLNPVPEQFLEIRQGL